MITGQIIERVRSGNRFMLTSHRKPDGDSIGSEMAMALILERLGKVAVVRNRDAYPSAYRRLPGIERILTGELPEGEQYDAVFTMECTEIERPGLARIGDYFIINIDHHHNNTMFGALNWVDIGACAVGEMIFDLAREMNLDLTPEIATHLYVSIATDTGFFHFSNTTARTFEICAELARLGANPNFVADCLYDHNRPGQIQLLGKTLSRLEIDWEMRIATIALFQSDFDGIDAVDGDTEGIINYPRSIDGVDVAVFFKEAGPRSFRVGIRARKDLNVAEVAAEFGGGGHPQASGCTIEGEYEEVRGKLFAALRRKLQARSSTVLTADGR